MLTRRLIVEVVASLARRKLAEITHYLPQTAFDHRLAAERAALQAILRWCGADLQDLEKVLKDPGGHSSSAHDEDRVAPPVVGSYCRQRDLNKEKPR